MNVGLVVPGFNSHEGDECIPALLALVRRLRESHHVRVITLRYPKMRRDYAVHGVQVRALGGGGARGLSRLPLLARALRAVKQLHRQEPFDILHGIWADEPGFVAAQAGRRLGIPRVVSLLGGELIALPDIGYGGRLSVLNRLLTARALKDAQAITAGSRYLAGLAETRGFHPAFLPLGIDTAKFHPGAREPSLLEGGLKLLHVASLVPVKDQSMLLKAFARTRTELTEAVLHVIGDGPLSTRLRSLAASLGIDSRVRFHGRLPHETLPRYYRSADLLVMSSRHEGQEWVTQEAAACGCPAVGTRVGVLPDLEPASVAVPVGDEEALARALVATARDRARRHVMGEAARQRIQEDYSLDVTVSKLATLYRELARSRARRRTANPDPSRGRRVPAPPARDVGRDFGRIGGPSRGFAGRDPGDPGLASIKRRIAQNDVESLSRHRSE